MSIQATAGPTPRLTVAFLLFNARGDVAPLLQGLVRQVHPVFPRQSDWLRAVFVDDASKDGTGEAAASALLALGSPAHYRLVRHPRNLGLAQTLNETFREATTPFVLTCHLDCRFGSERYAAGMLDLIEGHPRAAAITGQPELPPGARLPFAEKLNVVTNLMDIFPPDPARDLVPVGFAEGRCDVFRVAALRRVGLYDAQLRVSGEDQVLAAKLREAGYEVYQAPRLVYHLSVSAEQDDVAKILRHQHLFGRTTPYIVLSVPGSRKGLVGPDAGANRTGRALLRATQLAGAGVLTLVPISLLAGWPGWTWGVPLVLVAAARWALFARHARAVRFSPGELLRFVLLQPVLDLAYTAGILEGLLRFAGGSRSAPID